MSQFLVVPCTRTQANKAVKAWHRHHSPINDATFCVAIAERATGRVCGVAIAGRPATNALEDGFTIELRRVATDGTPNACSKLLAVARSVAAKLGYVTVQTYTLEAEGGASLRAAGYDAAHATAGQSRFTHRVKPRLENGQPRVVGKQARADRARQQGVKIRWEARSGRAPRVEWPEPEDRSQPALFPAPPQGDAT